MSDTQFSPEQQEVIDAWGRGLSVLAGAGCGKTTTLVGKCIALLKKDPEARFAAVSFTERSAGDLREKLALKLADHGGLAQHWVMTIHGLCGTIIREFPREAGFDGEETILSEPETQLLWERALEGLWFDDLPEPVKVALESLLDRESRDGVVGLLRRIRELHGFGVLDRLGTSEDPHAGALVTLARFVLERYERLKRRRGALDFNDLEKGADRALEVPRVRAAFQKRFDLVLVDEFQDTNPVQGRIIDHFVKQGGANLCIVGDPKQSIYRFRDADVSVFEEFCRKLPLRKKLTRNFRSRPGIIEFTNSICAAPFAESQLEYEPLVAQRPAAQAEGMKPVNEGFAPVEKLDVQGPDDLGRWIRAQMARGVPLHDMALLLRKIRGNEKWLKALTSAGVPVAIGSGGLFWEDPRVRELTAFLKWWDNPMNAHSGAVFLRAPWVAVPDGEIDRWVQADATLQAPFLNSAHPLARVLKPLRGKVLRPSEVLLALLSAEGGEQLEDELGAQLLGLWHRCEELSLRGLDFHGVASELALSMEQGRRERDVPPPRNQGQMMVLTLHGSKGLEFPHVILVDFTGKPPRDEMPLLFWSRENGAFLGVRDEDGDRDRKHPLEAEWRAEEKRKNLAEAKRLFYVALTRARERLVLVFPPEAKPAKEQDGLLDPAKAYGADNWRAWIEASGVECPASENGTAIATEAEAEPDPDPWQRIRLDAPGYQRARHSVTEWTLLSRCERAYEWKFIRPRVAKGSVSALIHGATGESAWALPDADGVPLAQRELGTRVHACLERGDYDGLKVLEMEAGVSRFKAEPLIFWASQSPLMAPSDADQGRETWSELSFEVPLAKGEILVGSIDRLVREVTPLGPRYTLIDFKVTRGMKSERELIEAYQAQLELYAAALLKLDPECVPEGIEAYLINIVAGAVQEVRVPLERVERVGEWVDSSLAVISGREGKARPGPLCGVCDFRYECPDAIRV